MIIRFADKNDREKIVEFLKENWNKNHILVTSPMMFEYQYMKQAECGFVIAEDEGKIYGIKGYLPLNNSQNPDITAALAISKNKERPMLNIEMQRFLEKQTSCRMSYSLGLNPNTVARIYPRFKYTVDKLNHYYRLADTEKFSIARIENNNRLTVSNKGLDAKQLNTPEEMLHHFNPDDFKDNLPYKDFDYINYRYYSHPVYKYKIYGLENTLIVTREIELNSSKVIRIVDLLGKRSNFANAGKWIDSLLIEREAEYIDFSCYGLPHEYLTRAGFSLRDSADPNIIPNYFEPYELKNVDINFFTNITQDILLCKADGDQDRPSRIPEV